MSDSEEIEDITPNGQLQQQDPNEGLHPLFWDSIPDNAEEHPDYIALKALDDETTPEERAENFKVRCTRQEGASAHARPGTRHRWRPAACGQPIVPCCLHDPSMLSCADCAAAPPPLH